MGAIRAPRPLRSLATFIVRHRTVALVVALAGSLAVGATALDAAPWSSPFRLTLIAHGFDVPSSVRTAGDGNLYVVERPGRVILLRPDGSRETILDISDRVSSNLGELGMYDVAPHPDGSLFVTYTDPDGDLILGNFRGHRERIVLTIPQEAIWHKGGGLQFGPDGMLYMGVGDDSTGAEARAWEPDVLLRSIIRIDPAGDPYAIPVTNPFARGGGAPEVYLHGFRNPWRFSFDPRTGDLFIGDVGAEAWEELNVHRATDEPGGNYGWSALEGTECRLETCPAGLIEPLYAYPHGSGDCAIIGGFIERRPDARFAGEYVFADVCGAIRTINPAGGTATVRFTQRGMIFSAMGQGEDGTFYLTANLDGELYRLDDNEARWP